jgi:catechol 2,3-dioxygenase-like lactoylglutathione lyase family enzyme
MEGKRLGALKAHVALYVADVGRSTEFYRRMLGLEPCKVRRGYAKFDVAEPPLNLTLNERPGVARGALSHMGIQVASTADVLSLRERWRAAGLATSDEFGTTCCYAVQDKTWVTDPDGNEWEVFVVLEDNLPEAEPCECGGKAQGAQVSAGEQACVEEGAGAVETQAGASCCVTETTVRDGQEVTECVATCCAPARLVK